MLEGRLIHRSAAAVRVVAVVGGAAAVGLAVGGVVADVFAVVFGVVVVLLHLVVVAVAVVVVTDLSCSLEDRQVGHSDGYIYCC